MHVYVYAERIPRISGLGQSRSCLESPSAKRQRQLDRQRNFWPWLPSVIRTVVKFGPEPASLTRGNGVRMAIGRGRMIFECGRTWKVFELCLSAIRTVKKNLPKPITPIPSKDHASRIGHTKSHFVTLFCTFLNMSLLCRSLYATLGNLDCTFPHSRHTVETGSNYLIQRGLCKDLRQRIGRSLILYIHGSRCILDIGISRDPCDLLRNNNPKLNRGFGQNKNCS